MWLVLTTLKQAQHTRQREIAGAIGLEDATLTHHLHRMERDGSVSRHRDPANRRNQVVTITADGEALFQDLLATVIEFDRRLRRGLRAAELDLVRTVLARLRTNAASPERERGGLTCDQHLPCRAADHHRGTSTASVCERQRVTGRGRWRAR